MKRDAVLAAIVEAGIVPVVRTESTEGAIRSIEAIFRGGIRVAEITMTVPGAIRALEKVADEFGNLLRYSTAAIAFTLQGPAELIGDNPFSLMGGCGAVWVKAGQKPGLVRLKAMHTALGTREVEIKVVAAEPERV